ncbi:MAG TPA: TraR/DksA C4-type zinc finger protein [Chitinophagaceae bacterium]|nr:TraR/DksA C4-type zinc finger protein [Chitinophagaceae bacterium]
MAVKKKPAKPAAKKASKPAKKAAPAKKPNAKPAKKVVAKAKPATKHIAAKAKPLAKPAKKQAVKPAVAKKAEPIKAAAKSKPVAKPVQKPIAAPVAKKVEASKPAVKIETPTRVPVKKMTLEEMKKEARKAVKAAEENVKNIKTTVKTAVKYNPEFTKSVLDTHDALPANAGPTQRYSDPELAEFKELIQRKLDAAKKELAYLQGLITRKDEMGGDEAENRYMTMEDGSISMEREQLAQMASRQITYIDHLEKALMRIENKTYGICRVTGKLIDKARLRAVPHATLSIEAKMGITK